jgi:transposase
VFHGMIAATRRFTPKHGVAGSRKRGRGSRRDQTIENATFTSHSRTAIIRLFRLNAVPGLLRNGVNFPETQTATFDCTSTIDGVTGRQPTVVAAMAVPQSDEVSNGVRIGLLQAAPRDDHGALCGYHVSLESASICVVDASGRIVREAKVASEPEVLIGWFGGLGIAVARIGLEAVPLSQWLYAGMRDVGLPVELLETRHVRAAFKAMPVKTDRKDARGIAQLMRLGWFRPVHCESLPAQEVRALLAARKLLQTKNHDVVMSLRGVLRGFGLKVGPTTPRTFPNRIRELVDGHPTLSTIAEALLAARGTLSEQWQKLEKRLRLLARQDRPVRLLMTAPGVGPDRRLDLCLGNRRSQPLQILQGSRSAFRIDPQEVPVGRDRRHRRISKIGDGGVRTALYEAANVILTRPVKGSTLKSWGIRLAARAGMRKAKVALARKLAVVLHRMLANGTTFLADKAAPAAAH